MAFPFNVPAIMVLPFKVPAFIQSATIPSVARIFKTAFPFLSTPAIYVLPPSDDIKIPSTVFFHIVLLRINFLYRAYNK